jgi:hypothetical protein
MARVPLIRSFDDAGEVDEADRADLKEFFNRFGEYQRRFAATLVPDGGAPAAPEPDENAPPPRARAMWAALANSPQLATSLLEAGEVMVDDLSWCQRRKMRELMYLALALHLRYHSLFVVHYEHSQKVGITPKQIAFLPYYQVSDVFDDEERFVIAYTKAVLDNAVTDDLFEQGRALYGTKEMVELSSTISYTAFKMMTYRALRAFEWPEIEEGR